MYTHMYTHMPVEFPANYIVGGPLTYISEALADK